MSGMGGGSGVVGMITVGSVPVKHTALNIQHELYVCFSCSPVQGGQVVGYVTGLAVVVVVVLVGTGGLLGKAGNVVSVDSVLFVMIFR